MRKSHIFVAIPILAYVLSHYHRGAWRKVNLSRARGKYISLHVASAYWRVNNKGNQIENAIALCTFSLKKGGARGSEFWWVESLEYFVACRKCLSEHKRELRGRFWVGCAFLALKAIKLSHLDTQRWKEQVDIIISDCITGIWNFLTNAQLQDIQK
jgi:hypothetical protein